MARRPLLEFEKPLIELEQQIEQIRQLARDSEVDVSQQLLQLETLAARRREEIFQNSDSSAENSGCSPSSSSEHSGFYSDVLR